MNVFDHLSVHKILRLTQILMLQKKRKNEKKIIKIVAWVVKQYIMIATRYSFFFFSPTRNFELFTISLCPIFLLEKVQKVTKLMSHELRVFFSNEGVILEAYQIEGNSRGING